MLDVLGAGGRGLPLLWPFSDARFMSPIRIFPDAPRGLALLSIPGAINVAIEFAVFLPMMLYAMWPRIVGRLSARRRRPRDPEAAQPHLHRWGRWNRRRRRAAPASPDEARSPDTLGRLALPIARQRALSGSGNLSPMIFGREREAVRNATRAIRDLVLRRELGGSGGLGGGLSAMAMMAVAPLRQLPEIATQVPGTLRDLGERMTAIPSARRRAPALAFAAQALAGSVRLRRRRCASATSTCWPRRWTANTAARVHPAFLTVLRQLTPDEVRIISTFQHDGPYPLLTVGARYRFGERLSTELRHFSLLGTQAGCEHPERVALYVDNLCRLGLAELRPVRIADDTRMFRAAGGPPAGPGRDRAHRGAHPRAGEREPGTATTATASSRTCSAPRST